MVVPVDPISTALAPFTAANAASNVVINSLNASREFSTVAKYHRFELTEIAGYSTQDLDGEIEGRQVKYSMALARGRDFRTHIHYRRHCSVAGVRCLRHHLVLQLTGSMAPYVVVDPANPVTGPIARGPRGPIYGFHNVRLVLGPNPGLKTHPFSKFNEESQLLFGAEFYASDGYIELGWKAVSGGFGIGGVPLAVTKAKNGLFRLGEGAVLTPVDADTWKYFEIHPITVPAPFDDEPAAEAREVEERRIGPRQPRVKGDRRAQQPRGRQRQVADPPDRTADAGESLGGAPEAPHQQKGTRRRISKLFRRKKK
ncbi:hypothetical protein [Amycolatopsis sp. H20-H5]|uniref:hypothetical protein n=1 Tax=Amycolatopsis sp. H20-H5 TaxID=3046309 RepID=UPI002DB8B5EA|nr:hypothetical protein [Amycolatopsis sp. H20-H5]MEC3981867.1 hypothetical protein [Amycolatopsis sp. H20-H5]